MRNAKVSSSVRRPLNWAMWWFSRGAEASLRPHAQSSAEVGKSSTSLAISPRRKTSSERAEVIGESDFVNAAGPLTLGSRLQMSQ
jgi:hypothetical protein